MLNATEIIDALRGHYKRITIRRVSVYKRITTRREPVEINDVHFHVDGVAPVNVAKFILARFPEVRWVFSEGGYTTAVYSRETVKWTRKR